MFKNIAWYKKYCTQLHASQQLISSKYGKGRTIFSVKFQTFCVFLPDGNVLILHKMIILYLETKITMLTITPMITIRKFVIVNIKLT